MAGPARLDVVAALGKEPVLLERLDQDAQRGARVDASRFAVAPRELALLHGVASLGADLAVDGHSHRALHDLCVGYLDKQLGARLDSERVFIGRPLDALDEISFPPPVRRALLRLDGVLGLLELRDVPFGELLRVLGSLGLLGLLLLLVRHALCDRVGEASCVLHVVLRLVRLHECAQRVRVLVCDQVLQLANELAEEERDRRWHLAVLLVLVRRALLQLEFEALHRCLEERFGVDGRLQVRSSHAGRLLELRASGAPVSTGKVLAQLSGSDIQVVPGSVVSALLQHRKVALPARAVSPRVRDAVAHDRRPDGLAAAAWAEGVGRAVGQS